MSINIGNATGNNIELIKIEKDGIDNESDLILLKNDENIVDNDNIFINYDNKFKTGIIETNSKYKYTITSNNNDTIGLYDSEEYIIQLDNDIINFKNNYINNIITKDFVIKNNTETEILKISNDTNKIIVKDNFDFDIELGTNEYNINSNNGLNLVKFNSNIALFNYTVKVDKIQVKEIIPHDNESGVEIRSLSIVENIFDDINIGKTTELDNKKTPLIINKSILNDTEENNIIEINKYNNEYTDDVQNYDKILVLNNKGLLSLGKCENINSNNFININNYDNEYVYSNIETNINSNVNYIFNYDGNYLGDSFNINKYGNISIGDKDRDNALLYINRNDDRLNLDDTNLHNYNKDNALLKLNLNYEEKNNYLWTTVEEKRNYFRDIFINRYFEENDKQSNDNYFINYKNNFKNVYTNINNQNNTELKEFFYVDENGDKYYFLNSIFITTLLDYKFTSLNLTIDNNKNEFLSTVYDKTQTYNVKYDKLNLKNNNRQIEYDFKTATWLTSDLEKRYRSHIFFPNILNKELPDGTIYNLELKLENIKSSILSRQTNQDFITRMSDLNKPIISPTHESFILYPNIEAGTNDINLPSEVDIFTERIKLVNYLAEEDPFINEYTSEEIFNKLNSSEEYIFKDFTVIGYTDDNETPAKTIFAIYISKQVYEKLNEFNQVYINYNSSVISKPNFMELSSNNDILSYITSDGTILYDKDINLDVSKDYSIYSKNKKGKFSELETNKINSLEDSDTISFEYNNIVNLGKVTFNENETYILKNLDTSNITNATNNFINYNDIVLNINKLDNIKEYNKTYLYSNLLTEIETDFILYSEYYNNNIINIDTHLDESIHPSISIYGSNPTYILKSNDLNNTSYLTSLINNSYKNLFNGIKGNNKDIFEIKYNTNDNYKLDSKSNELNSKHILQHIGNDYNIITLGENYNICIDNIGPIPTNKNDNNFGTVWINVGTTRPSYGIEINNELLKNKVNDVISLEDLETIKSELGITHFDFDNFIKKDDNYYVIYSNTHTDLLTNNSSNSSFKISLGIPLNDSRINDTIEGYKYNFPKYFKEVIKENSDYMLNVYGNTKIIGVDGETNGLSVKINENKSLIDNKHKVNLSIGKEVIEDENNNRLDIDGNIYANNLYYKISSNNINVSDIPEIVKIDIINNVFQNELSQSLIHTSNINNKQDNGLFDIKLIPKMPISNLLTPEAPYVEKRVRDYNQPLVNQVIISDNNTIYKRQFPSNIDYDSSIIKDEYNGYHYYYFNSINNENTTYNLKINDRIMCDVLIVGGGGGGGSFELGKYWLNIGNERPSEDINLITVNNTAGNVSLLINHLSSDDISEINSVKIIDNWSSYLIQLTEESYIYSNGNYFKTTFGAGGDGGQQILLESLTIEKDTSFDVIVGKGGNGSGFAEHTSSDNIAEVGGISKFNNVTANYGQKISNFRGIGQNGNINIGQKAYNIFNIVYENLGSNQNNIKYFAGQGGAYNNLGGIGGGGVLIDPDINDLTTISTGDATVIGSGGGYSQNGGWGKGKEGIVILRYKFVEKQDTYLEQLPVSELENTYLEYNWQLNDWVLNPYVGNTSNLLSTNIIETSNNLVNSIKENKNYIDNLYILSSNNNVYSNISSSNYINNIDNKFLLLNDNTSNYIKNIEYNLDNINASNITSGILNINMLPKIPFSKFYNLDLRTLYSPRVNHNIVEETEYYSSNIDYTVYDINNIKYCDYIILNYNDNDINISQQTNYLLEFQYDCKIDILMVGGGGGGGGTQSINAGGGGGGGVIYVKDVDITRGKSYNIKVGNGGNANKDGYDTEAFGLIARGGKKGNSDIDPSKGEGGLGGSVNISSGITEVQGKIITAEQGAKGGTSSRENNFDNTLVKGNNGVGINIYYNEDDGDINSTYYWGGGGGGTRWNNNGNTSINAIEGLRYGELPIGGIGGGGSGAFKYDNSRTNAPENEISDGGLGYNNGETISINVNDNLLFKKGGNGGMGTGGGGGGGFDTIYDDNISGSGGLGGSGIVIIKYYDINIPSEGNRSKGYLSYDYDADKWNMNSLDLINLDINIDEVYSTISTTDTDIRNYVDTKFTNAGAPLSYIVVPKSFITNGSISDLTIGSENIIGYMGKSSNYDTSLTQAEIDALVDENGLLTLSSDAYINDSNLYYQHLIKGSKFKLNTITNSNIADNTITSDKLSGQIDGSKIKNATIEFSDINGIIDAPITIINTLDNSNLNANLITSANVDISIIDFSGDKKLIGVTNIKSENNLIKIPINNFENIEIDINNIDISSNINGITKIISDNSNIPLTILNDVIIDVVNIENYGTEDFKLDNITLNGDIPINSITNINVPIKNLGSTSLVNTNSTLIYNGPSGLKWQYVSDDINNLVPNYNLIVNNYLKNKIRDYYSTYILPTITLNSLDTSGITIDDTKYLNVDNILFYTSDPNYLEWNFLSYEDDYYISNTYDVSIETIDGINYYKFGNLSYNEYKYLGFEIGTITLTNIPSEHPIGFLINDIDTLEVITSTTTHGISTIDGIDVSFYSGDITLQVKQNFTNLSYYCNNHGYMGGENRIKIKYDNKSLVSIQSVEDIIRQEILNIYTLNNIITLTQNDLTIINIENYSHNDYIKVNNVYFSLKDESKIPPNYIRNLNLSADQIDTTIVGSFLQNVNLNFDNAKLDPQVLGQISISPDDIDFVPGSLDIDLITNIQPSGLKWINIGTVLPTYGRFLATLITDLTILTDKLLPYGNITYLTDAEWESISKPDNFILSHMDYVQKLIDGELNYYRPANGLLDPRFVGSIVLNPSQLDTNDFTYINKLENVIIDTTNTSLDPRIIGNINIEPNSIDTFGDLYTHKLENVVIDTTNNLLNPNIIGNLTLKAEQLNNSGSIGSVVLSDLSTESIDPSLIPSGSIVINASNLKVGNGYKLPDTLTYNFVENSIDPSLLPNNIEISGDMIDTTDPNKKLESVLITGFIDTSNIGLNATIANTASITSINGDKINSVNIETTIDASIINNATIANTASITSVNGSKISGTTYIYGQDINPEIINDAIINIDNQSTTLLNTSTNKFSGDTILSGTIDASFIDNALITLDANTSFKSDTKLTGDVTITGIVPASIIDTPVSIQIEGGNFNGSNIEDESITSEKLSSNLNIYVDSITFPDGVMSAMISTDIYTISETDQKFLTIVDGQQKLYTSDSIIKLPIDDDNVSLPLYKDGTQVKISTKNNFVSLINDKALIKLYSLNNNTSIELESYYTSDYGANNIGIRNNTSQSNGGSVLKLSNSRFSILVNSDSTLSGESSLQNTMEFSNTANYSYNDLYVPKLVFNDGTSMTTAAISLLDANKQLIMNNTVSGFTYDDSLVTGQGFIHCNGLHAEFDITAYSSTTQSDKRLKKEIKNIEYNDEILKLNPVSFKWNDVNKSNTSNVGFIAQELEEILPNLVKDGADSYKSVNYTGLIPYLVKHIQKLENRIVDLEKKINN